MLYATTKKVLPQVASDIGLILWIGLWMFLAVKVREGVLWLATPVYQAQDAARSMSRSLTESAVSLADVPMLGPALGPSLESFGLTVGGLVIALQHLIGAIQIGAVVLATIVAVAPVVVYLWKWLPWRFTFVREATAGRKLIPADASAELFALRAMAHAPMSELVRVTPDPMGAWKRGDVEIIRKLANLELAGEGLRMPGGRPPTVVL